MKVLPRAEPVMQGQESNFLIEQNKLSCWIRQCGLKVMPLASLTASLHANQPPALLCCYSQPLVSSQPWLSHLILYKKKTANGPVFNFSYGLKLNFRYASNCLNIKLALGLWFPFCPYFVKTKSFAKFSQKLISGFVGAVHRWTWVNLPWLEKLAKWPLTSS